MGIRFRCPNGHKIHVKTYLAGKRGICPECGLKVPIPPQSDPEFADKPRKKRSVQAHPQPGLPSGSAVARPAPRHPGPEARSPVASRARRRTPTAPPLRNSSDGRPTRTPGEPRRRRRLLTRSPAHLTPSGLSVPRTGGQFGPAPGHVLREWIAEGRVTPDSYVWREGWPGVAIRPKRRSADWGRPATGAEPIPTIVTQAAPTSTSELVSAAEVEPHDVHGRRSVGAGLRRPFCGAGVRRTIHEVGDRFRTTDGRRIGARRDPAMTVGEIHSYSKLLRQAAAGSDQR